MKKPIAVLLTLSFLATLTACGGAPAQQKTTQTASEIQDRQAVRETLKTYITENIPREAYSLLYEESVNDITVYCTSDTIDVNVHTYMSFCIPAVADAVCPTIIEAVGQTDYPIGTIQIWYYAENSSGMISDTIVSWQSSDGATGTFASTKDTWGTKNTFILQCSIDDLYEHYEDCIGQIRGLIEEDGGDPDAILKGRQ